MKRAEFAPGFAELRGNISGKQTLEYADNNNPAFEAPNGVQYARNYRPSVIISKVARTGKFHFSIKTKSAVKVSNRSKFNMALLGGAGAVRAAILNNPTQRAQVEVLYTAAKAKGVTDAKTLDKYIFDTAYEALMVKKSAITFYVPDEGTQYYRNPWVFTSSMGAQSLKIKATIIAKFWMQLATNPITFYVSGMKGVAHATESFSDLISSGHNTLGLSLGEAVSTKVPVKLDAMYVCFDNNGVKYQAIGNRDIKDQLDTGVETLDFYLSDTIGQIPE